MAKASTPTGKPRRASGSSSAGKRRAKPVGTTVADIMKTPAAREVITAGLVTAVATEVASTRARKAAREEVAAGGTGTSPGAILSNAVATVASDAIQQLVAKAAKPKSRSTKPSRAGRGKGQTAAVKTSASKRKKTRTPSSSGSKS